MSSQETQPKRRESRSGTRKVSTLSVEQLERKRANDREAQRSIRQRTKEHIEQLEAQVSTCQSQIAEMRLRTEHFDEVMERNAMLEDEVHRLKQQLSSLTGRPEFAADNEPMGPFQSGWSMEDASNNTSPGIPTTSTLLSPHFTTASNPRTPSALSASSRASLQHEWQHQYPPTRSPSLGESSNPEYPNRMESYVIDGQLHQGQHILPSSIPAPVPQISFGSTSTPPQQQSESSFTQFPYGNRSLSMPNTSSISQQTPSEVYQSSTSAYPPSIPQSQERDERYDYQWAPPP
jgi:regulator of replication initiation timing